MAKKNEVKATFIADTREFTEGINKANSTLSKLRSELRLNSTQLDEAGDDADLLAQRQELLAQEARASATKVELLTSKLEAAERTWGENSREADRYATQLANAKNENAKIQAEIRRVSSGLDDQADAAKDAAGAMDGLGNVGEIALGNLGADLITEAATAITGLEEATRQYRNEQNKLEAIAKNSGQSVDALKDGYADLFAITGDETMSSTAVANMSAMGMSAENMDRVLNIATGTWAQFGDSIPIDGLAESVNESSKLGATLTGPVVDAINWANMSQKEWGKTLEGNDKAQKAFNKAVKDGATTEDAMNAALAACSTEQERQSLLCVALDGAYSGLADSYRKTNADVIAANEATANLTAAQAGLAEKVAPLQTAFTNLQAKGLTWFTNNLPVIVPLVTGFGTAMGGLWLVMNGATVITTVTTAFRGLNAVMRANPVGIVITVIASLVAAFITAYNTSETFRNKVNSAFAKVKSAVSSAISGIKGVIDGAKATIDGLGTKFNNVKAKITGAVDSIRTKVQNGMDKVKNIVNGLKLQLPKFKLPHFVISGGKIPWGIGGKGTAPSIDVQWYAKGAILTRPTIFGAIGDKLLGGGEAGAEAILPIRLLRDFINSVFQSNLFAIAAQTGGGATYYVYLNDVKVNGDEEIRSATKEYLELLVRKGNA